MRDIEARTPLLPRVRSQFAFKMQLTLLLFTAIMVPFCLLGRFPLRPVTELQRGRVDDWFGFQPTWVWVYVSLYLFTLIGPLLLTEPAPLRRYAVGMLGIALAGFAVFLVWPTAASRPPEAPGAPWLYSLLATIDPPTNSAPSLHCAYAVFSALVAEAAWRDRHPRWPARALWWTWCALICASTMFTKQHMFVDVVSGALLGAAAYPLFWRTS